MSVKLPFSQFQAFANQLAWNQLGRDYSTGKSIEVTEKINVRVLRATWSPTDERLFFIHEGILYIEEDDLSNIKYFPGMDLYSQSYNYTGSGLVTLSDIAYKGLLSSTDLNKWSDVNEFLLPACARGNQSFAFGHFVSEVLPDIAAIQDLLEDASNWNAKVITYPLEEWASQLLCIFGIKSSLVSPLPPVSITDFPTYTSYKISGRLYRNNNRDLSIVGLIPSNSNLRTHPHSFESLVVLSRVSAGPSRPMRWINIDECVNLFRQESYGVQASIVDPAVDGPLAFLSAYAKSTKTLFVSAPGSAVYNVLYLTSSPILIALDAISLGHFWEGQLADLRPYGHRIIFIANQLTNKVVQWDIPFSINALPSKNYLNALFKYMVSYRFTMNCERFIATCGNTYISLPLPP